MEYGIVNTLTLEGFRREFEAYGRTENFRPVALRRFLTIWKTWRMISAKILKWM